MIYQAPQPVSCELLGAVAAVEAAALPNAWGEAELRSTLSSPGAALWVDAQEEDGAVRAFCVTQQVLDELHILQLATHPDCRRQGLARRLLDAILVAAQAEGCVQALLEVRHKNAPAIALYQAAGFAQLGRRKQYYADTSEDALILGRTLG